MPQVSHHHRDLSPTGENETWLPGASLALAQKIQTVLLAHLSKYSTSETKSTLLTELEQASHGIGLFATFSCPLLRRVYISAATQELYAAHCTYAGTTENPTKHRNSETLKRDQIPQTHLSELLF